MKKLGKEGERDEEMLKMSCAVDEWEDEHSTGNVRVRAPGVVECTQYLHRIRVRATNMKARVSVAQPGSARSS